MPTIIKNINLHKTKEWVHLRLSILKRDEYTCQECKRKGIRTTADTVHHIEPYIDELFYETTNLISLCNTCHERMHIRITKELSADGKKWIRRRRLDLIKAVKVL